MKQILLLMLLVCLLMPLAQASDWGYENEEITLWADVFKSSVFFDVATANITIKQADNTSIIINQTMFRSNPGRFYYNFTPNVTGTHYAFVDYYDGANALLGQSSQSFAVLQNLEEASGLALVGILFGFMLFIGVLLFIAHILDAKEHIILRFLIFCFIIAFTFLIPRAVIDTVGVDNGTAIAFLYSVAWFMRVFFGYIVIYLVYKMATKFGIVTKIVEGIRKG